MGSYTAEHVPIQMYVTELFFRATAMVDMELRKSRVTAAKKRLKITGASTHPCFTPTCTGKEGGLR